MDSFIDQTKLDRCVYDTMTMMCNVCLRNRLIFKCMLNVLPKR